MDIRCCRPQPFVVVKCGSEPGIPCDVSGISQQIAEKFHGFEFMSVSADRLNTAVQMARRDLRKQKTHLPKAVEGLSLSPSNRQQTQKAANARSVERVNRQQRKGEMKKAQERNTVISLVSRYKKAGEVHPGSTASTSSPPTRDKPNNHRQWMEEVVCMCEEMDCCLTKIRLLQETACGDPPRRFLMEEPCERQKRLIRIEEQKTRSTRILYTLSQKLREIDHALTKRPKPAKKDNLLRQLAAISRSSIRALNEFVQHLRDFNLAEGMPRMYDNLVVLLSQIIECFERLDPHSMCPTDSKSIEATDKVNPPKGEGDQPTSHDLVQNNVSRPQKVLRCRGSRKGKSALKAPPVIVEPPEIDKLHPLRLLRQKYPLSYHSGATLPDDTASEISIITSYSSNQAMSVVPPEPHSNPRKSSSHHSTRSSPITPHSRSPSPLHITDQLEELIERQIELPSPCKHVHTHVPWVLEPEKPRVPRHNLSPKHREEWRQSPDPHYADPTISSKKHQAGILKFESEPVRGRKQKSNNRVKQRPASPSKSDTQGLSSQEDEKKTEVPKVAEMTLVEKRYNNEIMNLRDEMSRHVSRLIEHESGTKKKIKSLLENSKDRLDADKLTEMILHEIMVDTVNQLSAAFSDDDTESNMSQTPNGISADTILHRLDNIEAEQTQIRQRWDDLQYKPEPNNQTNAVSGHIPRLINPKPIRLTVPASEFSRPVKPRSSVVKMFKSVSPTNSTASYASRSTSGQPRSALQKTPSTGAVDGQSVNNNNSHLVAVPMSEQLIASIINSQRLFQRYLKQSANMKVGRFNPWKVVDEVSEEILDVCITDICGELEQFNSDIANHIYSSEFASESSSDTHESAHPQTARCSGSPEPRSNSSIRSSVVSKTVQTDSRGHILERNWSPAMGSDIKNLKT
ncbi:hypothetical protein LSAT2_006448 [Lamellibrachia satsuma]|nr:hypothetical protein LSAT2_006448 [Lamellibrachia satsuma]